MRQITKLDHVTIRTTRLAETRAFFIALFGLEEGPRPKSIQRISGHWLYAEDEPIIHLVAGAPGHPERGVDGIDHVALRLYDYEGFVARLTQLDIAYSAMVLDDIGERRIFLRTPGGTLIEAVFRNADASASSRAPVL